jgi:hypothetical protein
MHPTGARASARECVINRRQAFDGMTTILQNSDRAADFDLPTQRRKNFIAIFWRQWRQHYRKAMCRSQGKCPSERENDMNTILKMAGAPAMTLFALAFVALTTPTAASAGEYCRQDITSGMRSCSFSTLEQCQAMSAGRGGDCYRDPFLETNSNSNSNSNSNGNSNGNSNNAFAYQPASSHPKRVRKPVVNQ